MYAECIHFYLITYVQYFYHYGLIASIISKNNRYYYQKSIALYGR